MKDQHLIPVDELRAAGALDVPEAWRHTLQVERDLFSGFIDDEENHPENLYPTSSGEDENEADDDGHCPNTIPTHATV